MSLKEQLEGSHSFSIEPDHAITDPTIVLQIPYHIDERSLTQFSMVPGQTTFSVSLFHLMGYYERILRGAERISQDYPGQVVLLDPMQDEMYTRCFAAMNKQVLAKSGLISGDSRLRRHEIPSHVGRPRYLRDQCMVGNLGEQRVVTISQKELIMGSSISDFGSLVIQRDKDKSSPRTNADALVDTVDILQSVSGREGAYTDIHTEGGNVIATRDHVFSLSGTLRSIAEDRKRNRLSTDDNSCLEAYCTGFGADGTRTALILDWDVRRKEQPIYHLDLIAQPITNSEGEEIILISDLELGFNILQENRFIKRSSKGNLKVTRRLIDEQLNREGDQDIDTYFDTLYPRSIYDNLSNYFDTKNIEALVPYISHIKRKIEECGYRTLSVPFLYSRNITSPRFVDNPWAEIKGAVSPVYAPVNGIFADHPDRGKVFYTIGGIQCLDEYTKSALAQEGVDVVTIKEMDPLAHHGFAGLRCASILV